MSRNRLWNFLLCILSFKFHFMTKLILLIFNWKISSYLIDRNNECSYQSPMRAKGITTARWRQWVRTIFPVLSLTCGAGADNFGISAHCCYFLLLLFLLITYQPSHFLFCLLLFSLFFLHVVWYCAFLDFYTLIVISILLYISSVVISLLLCSFGFYCCCC
jgi:hypothetical protein